MKILSLYKISIVHTFCFLQWLQSHSRLGDFRKNPSVRLFRRGAVPRTGAACDPARSCVETCARASGDAFAAAWGEVLNGERRTGASVNAGWE
jgi:hypothetical protein